MKGGSPVSAVFNSHAVIHDLLLSLIPVAFIPNSGTPFLEVIISEYFVVMTDIDWFRFFHA